MQAYKMNYGLSIKTTCQFAYEMTDANNITSASWLMNKTAGINGLQGFTEYGIEPFEDC